MMMPTTMPTLPILSLNQSNPIQILILCEKLYSTYVPITAHHHHTFILIHI